MIEARRRLVGLARGMFESHLRGLVSWDTVKIDEAEKAPIAPGERVNKLGKHRERVTVRFGDGFVLDVRSPEDAPPLGHVELICGDQLCEQGPLDAAVWNRIGGLIREQWQ